MKYNKNANTFLFLLLFTSGQREKKCRRSIFTPTSAESLSEFLVRFLLTYSIVVLLSTFNGFKKQQETTKRTLRL